MGESKEFLFFLFLSINPPTSNQFQNRRMKWKRSRKAQQESKNKDNHSGSEEKQPRERSSSNSNQSSSFKNGINEKVPNGNFHFPKNIDSHSHLPPHPAISHQRHLNSLPGSSKEIQPSCVEENYSNNLISRQPSVFNDGEDMIWRVV